MVGFCIIYGRPMIHQDLPQYILFSVKTNREANLRQDEWCLKRPINGHNKPNTFSNQNKKRL